MRAPARDFETAPPYPRRVERRRRPQQAYCGVRTMLVPARRGRFAVFLAPTLRLPALFLPPFFAAFFLRVAM
jgi:hypothetical protein